MAQCTQCQFDLGNVDFGLIECPRCGSSLMVEMDGSISESTGPDPTGDDESFLGGSGGENLADLLSDELIDAGDDGYEEAVMKIDPATTELIDTTGLVKPPVGHDPESGAPKGMFDDYVNDDPSHDMEPVETYEEDGEASFQEGASLGEDVEEESADADLSEGHFPGEGDEYDEVSQAVDLRAVGERTNAASLAEEPYQGDYHSATDGSQEQMTIDLEAFGETEAFRDGALTYNLKIQGLDSADLKNQVLEILSDRRLLLDAKQIIGTLRNGELRIGGLSPVMMHVICRQLLALPLTLDWEQIANGNP